MIYTNEQMQQRKQIFADKVLPLMKQIHELCEEHKFYVTSLYQIGETEESYAMWEDVYIEGKDAANKLSLVAAIVDERVPSVTVAAIISLLANMAPSRNTESNTEES